MMKQGGQPMSRAAMPTTQPKPPLTAKCKRTCCWTPFGHKVDARNCTCHVEQESLYV